ncbi:unnamed protein product [Rangifer tarandus platyrhynchus]|uniref:Uncharacterized protein n=2 Tax=Rangifer tarandus platyrhynchus TaxID=3082113 RepID=A0ABN8Y5L7_RANTA|nr:unnamed protein product [Rangifer tarandus platyrhynchus]
MFHLKCLVRQEDTSLRERYSEQPFLAVLRPGLVPAFQHQLNDKKKPGAQTNPWPTLGSVVLRRPVMSVMDGVVFAWSSGPCPAGLSRSFAQTPRLMMCTWFHCWSLEFQLLWLIDSWMCLCDPSPVNTWTLRRVRVFSTSDSAVLHWRQSLS